MSLVKFWHSILVLRKLWYQDSYNCKKKKMKPQLFSSYMGLSLGFIFNPIFIVQHLPSPCLQERKEHCDWCIMSNFKLISTLKQSLLRTKSLRHLYTLCLLTQQKLELGNTSKGLIYHEICTSDTRYDCSANKENKGEFLLKCLLTFSRIIKKVVFLILKHYGVKKQISLNFLMVMKVDFCKINSEREILL